MGRFAPFNPGLPQQHVCRPNRAPSACLREESAKTATAVHASEKQMSCFADLHLLVSIHNNKEKEKKGREKNV
jgi:hypothetical protein